MKDIGGEPRPDGRHVLVPTICSTFDHRSPRAGVNAPVELHALHNEGARSAAEYPLAAMAGEFFSEAMSPDNPEAAEYLDLVSRSILTLCGKTAGGALAFDDLMVCGPLIQELDAAFAATRIGRDLDSLHRCAGPDPSHPYAKITLCRTTIPVAIGADVVPFFFEKYLVAYAYIDEHGERRSTRTPIHSHPLNFETVYFTHFGPRARVVEQEFHLETRSGVTLVGPDGHLQRAFFDADSGMPREEVVARPGAETTIEATALPTKLAPFRSELALGEGRSMIGFTDGLFRPHQVTVVDDPMTLTGYFAIDNYFGPRARVLLFEPGRSNLWRHDDWG